MAKCKSCEAEIIWAETPTGKNIALDAEPVKTASSPLWVLINGKARMTAFNDMKVHRPTYTCHFNTCPDKH